MQDLIAIYITFFTELLIALFCLLFVFSNNLVVLCILNLWQKRGSTDEQTWRDFLEEYVEGNFELLSFI